MQRLTSVEKMKAFIKNSFDISLSRWRNIYKKENEVVLKMSGVLSSRIYKNAKNVYQMYENEPSMQEVNPRHFSTTTIERQTLPKASLTPSSNIPTSFPIVIENGFLLTTSFFCKLTDFMPMNFRNYVPTLCYSLETDGKLFSTMYSKCSFRGPCIIMIKTISSLFCAVLSEALSPSKSNNGKSYYGDRQHSSSQSAPIPFFVQDRYSIHPIFAPQTR
jgi:hypothetical protein